VAVLIEADISHPATSPFFARVTQRVRHHLREAEQRSILYAGYQPPAETWDGQLSCPEFWESLDQGVLSGVVCLATRSDSRWLSRVLARGVPVVGDDPGFGYRVSVDHEDLVRKGVEYLAAQGCRNLALIGWGCGALFERLLREHSLEARADWICCDVNPSVEGGGWQQFHRLWQAYVEKPDGLLIADDLLFATARTAIREATADVARGLRVVTHANKGFFAPGLFPVAQLEVDPEAYALQMAQMTVALLSRKEPERKQVTVQATLIPEDRCAVLAQQA
jgi:DNA-binding LacI/PurR family transcriptional regulator